jgi:opacity protein-like surface antigen
MTLKRLVVLLVLLALSTSLHAQRFNQKREYEGLRDGTWEATLLLGSQGGLGLGGENGSAVDFDSELAWGFSVGWNWTEKWNLSWRFMLAKPDYTATIVSEDPDIGTRLLSYSADRYSNQFSATYHFLRGPLTPYVQAGLGWAKVDSNIPSQPPTTGCWWDPWWGYICDTTWNTYDASGFSYSVGLGLRWDINSALFMRGSVNREFFSADRADFDFDTYALELGLMW